MDENYVSKEVLALIERMETFPNEFIMGKEGGYWAEEFQDTFGCGHKTTLAFLLTRQEYSLLEEAYRKLQRDFFFKDVVTHIIDPAQGEFDFGHNHR